MDTAVAVDVPERGRSTVARLSGELNEPDISYVEGHLLDLERTPGLAALFVDLTSLDFIDSSGIALLLRFKRRSVEHGYEFGVRGISGMARDRLDRTGLLAMLLADDRRPTPGRCAPGSTPGDSVT